MSSSFSSITLIRSLMNELLECFHVNKKVVNTNIVILMNQSTQYSRRRRFKDVGSAEPNLKKFLVQRPTNTMLHIRNIEAGKKEVQYCRVTGTCQSTRASFL